MNTATRPETTAIQVLEPADYGRAPATTSATLILQGDAMERIFKFAEMMAQGVATVPKHLQGKPADCLAIVMQATQWGMNPFAVAQKTHIVNGTLGYEAQLVNAVLQSSGSIRGEFQYEYRGNAGSIECRVGAVTTGGTAVTWGEWLCENTVTTKNSPLWKTNPKQQLGYLQVKNWARAFRPAAILGVYTSDELEAPQPARDMGAAQIIDQSPAPATYPQDQFEKNLPAWRKVIDSGRKTADQIISMAQTKHPLTDEQKAQIKAVPAVIVTYAQVAEKLTKAADIDALNVAGDLIGEVADPAQRAELSALFDTRNTEL